MGPARYEHRLHCGDEYRLVSRACLEQDPLDEGAGSRHARETRRYSSPRCTGRPVRAGPHRPPAATSAPLLHYRRASLPSRRRCGQSFAPAKRASSSPPGVIQGLHRQLLPAERRTTSTTSPSSSLHVDPGIDPFHHGSSGPASLRLPRLAGGRSVGDREVLLHQRGHADQSTTMESSCHERPARRQHPRQHAGDESGCSSSAVGFSRAAPTEWAKASTAV